MNKLIDITNNISCLQLLDEKELDLTWNYFIFLEDANKMLILSLTKLCMIPMVDYMSPYSESNSIKLFEELGITEEKAISVQNLNIQLLNIQKALQLYCGQSYNLLSISSKFLSVSIDDMSDETNIGDIENFTIILEAYELETQRGGTMNDMFKKTFFINVFRILILFLLVVPGVQSSNASVRETSLSVTNNNIYKSLVISTPQQLLETINEANYETPIDLSGSIVVYDKEFNSKYNGVVGTLISYLNNVEPSGKKLILNIIEDVNNNLRGISSGLEKSCLELMKKTYDQGVFASWNSLDNIEAIETKTQELSEGYNWLNWFSRSNRDKEIGEVKKELHPTSKLTLEGKKDYENKMYYASRLYCSFGYNFQLSFNERVNTLNLVGGKVEYVSIIELIDSLDGNLNFKIQSLNEQFKNDKSKKTELNILLSTQQRLDVLKEITNKLYDIIYFSFKTHILNVQSYSSKNTINEIKSYFDNQLTELNGLLEKMNELFPKQREKIEQERQIEEAKIIMKAYEQKTLDIQSTVENIIRQQITERDTINSASKWNATEAYFKTLIHIGEGSIKLTGEAGKSAVGGITRELANVVGQVPKELVNSSLSLLNDVLKQFLKMPSGWIILSVPMFILFINIGQMLNFITVFTSGWKKLLL